MPGAGGGLTPNVFSVNSFYGTGGGTASIADGQTAYLPFYSYQGGTLDQFELYIISGTFTQLNWSIMDHAADGSPGSVLLSGTLSNTTGWTGLPLGTGTNLTPQQYYLLRLQPTGGLLSLMSPQMSPYALHTSYSPPTVLLIYSSGSWSQLTGNPYRHWAFMYRVAGVWYGQPLTNANQGTPLYGDKVGLSFRLTSPVQVIGAIVVPATSKGSATVEVYQCDSSFLPTGSPVTSVTAYRTVAAITGSQMFIQFGAAVELQNFSIVVSPVLSNCAYSYDEGTSDATRFDRIWSHVRSVRYSGGSWSVAITSPTKPLLYTQLVPVVSFYGQAAAPMLVPTVYRGVERC